MKIVAHSQLASATLDLAIGALMLPALAQSVFKKKKTKEGQQDEKKDMQSTVLYDAVQQRALYAVTVLLADCEDIDAYDARGCTALLLAAGHGFEDIVDVLVAGGADVNKAALHDGMTPLCVASFDGHLGTVRSLLKYDAEVDKQNKNGLTPLIAACVRAPSLDVLNELLKCNAEVDKVNAEGASALLVASQNGHVEAVRVLLQHDAQVNKTSNSGMTPLFSASKNGHLTVAELLLENGADVDVCANRRTPLSFAAQEGHHAVVGALLHHGAKTELRADSSSPTALFSASKNGHLEVVQALLAGGADVNAIDEYGVTPLSIASQQGHLDIVRKLIAKDAHVDRPSTTGTTPLYAASLEGHLDVVDYLVRSGADVNKGDINGSTPLFYAAQNGHLGAVKSLVLSGALPHLADKYGWTPLLAASRMGHLSVVSVLLDSGADVNVTDAHQMTPLFIACQLGHLEIVSVLLDRGARVDQVTAINSSPLYVASCAGHTDIVKKLIEFGADVDKVDAEHASPLYMAAQNGHAEAVKTLLAHKCQVDLRSSDGVTPLHIASQLGHATVVSELIRCGAKVDATDNEGVTPLYIACQKGHHDAVELLLRHGAQVSKRDNEGFTPLLTAVEHGHLRIISTLVEHGADVNMANSNGDTALYMAAGDGNLEIVKVLLGLGAQVHRANSSEATALSVASYYGHADVVQELVKAGAQANKISLTTGSSLYLASQEGDLKTVRVLLDCGADVNLENFDGTTPLLVACKYGHVAVVNELLKRGAHVSTSLEVGVPPLFAASYPGHLPIAIALLDSGAEVDSPDYEGTTSLAAACTNGHCEVALELLRRGATVDLADPKGDTPLIRASRQGHLQMVKILIDAKASVHKRNASGETSLSAAAQAGKFDVVRELVDAGASVHAQPFHGENCLVSAARLGHRGTADLIIRQGFPRSEKSQSSVVDATLQTLDEYSPHTREFEPMWDSVVRRLANFYGHMKTDTDLFAKTISQFLEIIFGMVKLKSLCEANNIFFRVMVSRHVTNRIRDFHTEIDELQKSDISGAVEGIENAKWEYDAVKMVEVFRTALSENHEVYFSLRYNQFETTSLLQNELQRHRNHHREEMLELLCDCLEMVLNFSKVSTAPSVPDWLIPSHELDLSQSSQLQHRSDGEKTPFRAKWLSSAVMLCEFDLPHQAFVKIATRWYNLRHPNLVKLFGAAHLRQPYVAVYEVCWATNLREYLSSPQKKHRTWQKLLEVALGLTLLHEKDIVLGNFQCRHLWIDELGAAKINGFQIAASNLQPERDPESVRWQAPECVRGGPSSMESDIYSFGMCILEAVSGQIPWSGEKTAETAASRIVRGAVPLQPAEMTDSQWRVVQEMCWPDPSRRWKISHVVEALKQFAEDENRRETGRRSEDALVISQDLRDHVSPKLESSLKEYLETLELNISLFRENGEEIGLIFHRLKRIYEWLCSTHTRPSDLGVATYCEILLAFKEFLRISAYSPQSKLERAQSQKVSLRNNVLHKKIDELLELLEITGSGSIHEWRKHRPIDTKERLGTDEDSQRTSEEPENSGKRVANAVEVVHFKTNTGAPTLNSAEKPRLIPPHKLQFNRNDLIGKGSFGEVLRGTWSSTPVVVKYMGYAAGANGYPQELFLHELRVWWQLSHPNVVRLYGACDVDKRYFVCESIAGGTLRDYLKFDKNRNKKWQKLYEIAKGLLYLHDKNILHNDLKGNNFLVGADGKAKIIDFGYSSILNIAEVKLDVKHLGALRWRSPECLRGDDRLTLKSDIYAFGMCIVEAISGEFPWESLSDAAVRYQVLRKKALPRQPETMSDRQWSLVRTMCAFDPQDRIGIASVVDRLDEFAQHEATRYGRDITCPIDGALPFCILVGAQNTPSSPHSPPIDAWRWCTRAYTELRVFEVSLSLLLTMRAVVTPVQPIAPSSALVSPQERQQKRSQHPRKRRCAPLSS